MDDALLEPLNAYERLYKDDFARRAQERLDELVKRSGVDVGENKSTVERYNREREFQNAAAGKAGSQSSVRTFLIVLTVIAFIVAVIGIFTTMGGNTLAGVLMIVLGVLIGVGLILIITLKLNKLINANSAVASEHDKKAQKLLDEAWSQMQPLNDLFESNEPQQLIKATIPLIQIDDYFNNRRYDYLSGKYGYTGQVGENEQKESVVALLSGEILSNPFVVQRKILQTDGNYTYTGSLEITWETSYTDSEGNVHWQNHSQTLTASLAKYKPYFSENTMLIYGNDAAPDLSFSHDPTHAERMSEKELERTVKQGEKEIRKQQEKALKQGVTGFTEMGDSEFDVLFNATDRNHDVQFRLLFTPLARKNMLTLMKSNVGYGDDFKFYKRKCLNGIESQHSANSDLDTARSRYASFDFATIHDKYLNFVNKFFKDFYFDLAPLLSVPLYQQQRPKEYIYKDSYESNYPQLEVECEANMTDGKFLLHPDSNTAAILKTQFVAKNGETDEVNVTAYSFHTENRTDYVTMRGGDGYMHDVPVHWVEYIPVQKTTGISLKHIGLSEPEFNDVFDDNFLDENGELKEREVSDTFGREVYYNGRHIATCVKNDDENNTDPFSHSNEFDAKMNELFGIKK